MNHPSTGDSMHDKMLKEQNNLVAFRQNVFC